MRTRRGKGNMGELKGKAKEAEGKLTDDEVREKQGQAEQKWDGAKEEVSEKWDDAKGER